MYKGDTLSRCPAVALVIRTQTGCFGAALSPHLRQEKPLTRPRVLLADDHEDFLAVEGRLLAPEFDVVQAVGDGGAMLEEAARLKPTSWCSTFPCPS